MKIKMQVFLLLIIALLCSATYGQRRDVNTLTSSEQQTLACNFKSLLDNYHEELVHRHTALTIHNTDNFFVWHKFYIHTVEKFLHSNFNSGSFESSPMPFWNPLNPIPNDFFNPNTDGSALCDRANNIFSPPSPPEHAGIWTALEFQNINTTAGGKNGRFNNTFNGSTTKLFFTNVNASVTFLCNQSSRDNLTNSIGFGAGHHGNVHLAVGGCFGGNFHQAPNATIFSIWHSYLDKIWHDWEECNCGKTSKTSNADLYIADRESDDDLTATTHNGIDAGYEPNEAPTTYPMWISNEIWVRNQQDGIQYQEHENPEYQTGKVTYVYVRVRNRGCATSSGNEQLKLYWAKANTSLDYPNAWTGINTLCSNPSGSQIGAAQTITPLQPDGYKIYVFEFQLPKPGDYSCVPNINHFCLLARITDSSKPNDGMTFAETADIYSNVRNNNNIAWKNISILDNEPNSLFFSASVRVLRSKLSDDARTNLVFNTPFVRSKHREKTNILDYSRVSVKMSPKLYEAFKSANKKMKIRNATIDKNGLINILGKKVVIPVDLQSKEEEYVLTVYVSKPEKLPKYLPELKFDLVQMDGERKIVGGQRFVIPVNKYKTIKDKK